MASPAGSGGGRPSLAQRRNLPAVKPLAAAARVVSRLNKSPLRTPGPSPVIAFGKAIETPKPKQYVDEPFAWETDKTDEIPYYLQGDTSMNTRENLIKRNALRMDPRVKRAIQMMWDMFPKTLDMHIEKKEYVGILVRICKLVIPEFELEQARETAEGDWERDAKGNDTMSFKQFFNAFFELADIWCPDIDGAQYARFLDTLRTRLTVMKIHKRNGTVMRRLATVMRLTRSSAEDHAAASPIGDRAISEPYVNESAVERLAKINAERQAKVAAEREARRKRVSERAPRGRGGRAGRGRGGRTPGGGGSSRPSSRGSDTSRPRSRGGSRPGSRAGGRRDLESMAGDPDAEAAATRIGAAMRGKRDRQRVAEMRRGKAGSPAERHLKPSDSQASLESAGKRSTSSTGRPVSPRPGDRPDVYRPSTKPKSRVKGTGSTESLVDLLSFDHKGMEDGDVVTFSFADIDEIDHCPDMIVEETQSDLESDSEAERKREEEEEAERRRAAAAKRRADRRRNTRPGAPPLAGASGGATLPDGIASSRYLHEAEAKSKMDAAGAGSAVDAGTSTGTPYISGPLADAVAADGSRIPAGTPVVVAADGSVAVAGATPTQDGSKGGVVASDGKVYVVATPRGVGGPDAVLARDGRAYRPGSAEVAAAGNGVPALRADGSGITAGLPVVVTAGGDVVEAGSAGAQGVAGVVGSDGLVYAPRGTAPAADVIDLDAAWDDVPVVGIDGQVRPAEGGANRALAAHAEAEDGRQFVPGTPVVVTPAGDVAEAGSGVKGVAGVVGDDGRVYAHGLPSVAGGPEAGIVTSTGGVVDDMATAADAVSAAHAGEVRGYIAALAPSELSTAGTPVVVTSAGEVVAAGLGVPGTAGVVGSDGAVYAGKTPALPPRTEDLTDAEVAAKLGAAAVPDSMFSISSDGPGDQSAPPPTTSTDSKTEEPMFSISSDGPGDQSSPPTTTDSKAPEGVVDNDVPSMVAGDAVNDIPMVTSDTPTSVEEAMSKEAAAASASESKERPDTAVTEATEATTASRPDTPDQSGGAGDVARVNVMVVHSQSSAELPEAPAAAVAAYDNANPTASKPAIRTIREMLAPRIRKKAKSGNVLLSSMSLRKLASAKAKRIRQRLAGDTEAKDDAGAAESKEDRVAAMVAATRDDNSDGVPSSSEDEGEEEEDIEYPFRADTAVVAASKSVAVDDARDPYLSDEDIVDSAVRPDLQPPRVLVAGKPGAGKTTLSAKLAGALAVPHIGVQAVLEDIATEHRARIARQQGAEDVDEEAADAAQATASTAAGALRVEIADTLAAGGAVDHATAMKAVAHALAVAAETGRGFVLDGVLGSSADREALASALTDAAGIDLEDIMPNNVVHLTMDDEDVVIRATNAASDPASGANLTAEAQAGYAAAAAAGDEGEDEDGGGAAAPSGIAGLVPLPGKVSGPLVSPPEAAAPAVESALKAYAEDSLLVDPDSQIVVDATQTPDSVFQQAMLRLGEGFPPFARVAVPAARAHAVALPEDVATGPGLAQRQYLLYGDAPELRPPEAEADAEEGEEGEDGGEAGVAVLPGRHGEDAAARRAGEASRAKTRAWSKFRNVCPVSLMEEGRPVRGSPAVAAEYRGKMYMFATPEARDLFVANPAPYLAQRAVLPDTTRVAVVGPPAAGSSTVASRLNAEYGLKSVDAGSVVARVSGAGGSLGKAMSAEMAAGAGLPVPLLAAAVAADVAALQAGTAVGAADGAVDPRFEPKADEGKEGDGEDSKDGGEDSKEEGAETTKTLEGDNGWLMTGMPASLAQWKALLEAGVVPDSVVLLDPSGDGWAAEAAIRSDGQEFAGGVVQPPAVPSAEQFAAELPALVEALTEAGVEVKVIKSGGGVEADDVYAKARQVVDPFAPRVDDPAEWEALPEEARLQGDTGRYCPVTLKDHGTLVPGKPELAVRINDATYIMADEAAKEAFETSPGKYLHQPTGDAVASGDATAIDSPPSLPPPRILVLAPHGVNLQAHLDRLSAELGVDVVAVQEDMRAHPSWGPQMSAREDAAAHPAAGEEGGEEGEDGEEGEGQPFPPPQAYADVLKDAYRRPKSAKMGCVLGEDLADVVTPELAADLLARKVPPSLIVPVGFDPQRIAEARLAKEFKWVPPPPPVAAEGEDGEEEEEPPAPPTQEELAEMEAAAREEALAAIVAELEADKERLGGVDSLLRGTGVDTTATVDFNAANPDRVYARLLAAVRPHVVGEQLPVVSAAPVPTTAAKAQLESGRRRLSKFGPYCPVALLERGELTAKEDHPVLYRRHVYMTESAAAARRFALNPPKYLAQAPPPPAVPPSAAVIGASFSYRTDTAKALAASQGVEYVSVPVAVEWILRPDGGDNALRRELSEATSSGAPLSDALAARAVARFLQRVECQSQGYVLDGFPATQDQVVALDALGVRPRTVVRLAAPETHLLQRAKAAAEGEARRVALGLGDGVLGQGLAKVPRRKRASGDEDGDEEGEGGEEEAEGEGEEGETRPVAIKTGGWPAHAAAAGRGLAVAGTARAARDPATGAAEPVPAVLFDEAGMGARVTRETQSTADVAKLYESRFENVRQVSVRAPKSAWSVANEVASVVSAATRNAREYQRAVFTGRAAAIQDVAIPKEDLDANMGFTRTYCPVRWATRGELANQAGSSAMRRYGCAFDGQYYFPAGEEEQAAFIADPTRFLNRRKFPTDAKLPHRVSPAHVHDTGAKVAMKGFCPVTMLDTDEYERLVPGQPGLAVLYRKRLFLFASEDAVRKFMACPDKYARQRVPPKLPPRIAAVPARKLATSKVAGAHGYLEQELSVLLVKALSALEAHKDTLKHPALSPDATAQVFVALHLSAHNPRSSDGVRQRQLRRLAQFVQEATIAQRMLEAAPAGSAARAARLSPRTAAIAEMGAEFDKLRKETAAGLRARFLTASSV